jgi:choline kinase
MPGSVLEAVILAGGEDARLHPLTSQEHPKCLLSVGNSTLLLYSLTAVKQVGIKKIFVVRSITACSV